MNRDDIKKKMADMYARAEKGRAAGKRELARTFRAGARRLARDLKKLPVPVPVAADAKADAAPAAS